MHSLKEEAVIMKNALLRDIGKLCESMNEVGSISKRHLLLSQILISSVFNCAKKNHALAGRYLALVGEVTVGLLSYLRIRCN